MLYMASLKRKGYLKCAYLNKNNSYKLEIDVHYIFIKYQLNSIILNV